MSSTEAALDQHLREQDQIDTETMPIENVLMDLNEAAYHLQEAITNLENVAANVDSGIKYKFYLIKPLMKLQLTLEKWIVELKE